MPKKKKSIKKKKKLTVIITVIAVVLLLAGLALLFFSYANADYVVRDSDGISETTIFAYDKYGKKITGIQQTAVEGIPNINYISVQIVLSNDGSAALDNFSIVSSGPVEFTLALQNAEPARTSLNGHETGIIMWDTANFCLDDTYCGVSEECVAGVCLMDVSQYVPAERAFSLTISADSIFGPEDASNYMLIEFEQDYLAARFEQFNFEGSSMRRISDFKNTWIAYDATGDGILEGYGGGSSVTGSSRDCVDRLDIDFIVTYGRYGNFILQKYSSNEIRLCRPKSTGSDYIKFTKSDSDAARAILSNQSTSPYSELCGELVACRERYGIGTGTPAMTCGDGVKEDPEICDSSDLGDASCSSFGFVGGTLQCGSDCASWDTSLCEIAGGSYVSFRTGLITYDFRASCDGGSSDGTRWIAYTDTCTTDLVPHMYITSSTRSGGTCAVYAESNGWIELTGLPYERDPDHLLCKLNRDGEGFVTLYECSAESGITDGTELCICENDLDAAGGLRFIKFRNSPSLANEIAQVNPSPLVINPSHEIRC